MRVSISNIAWEPIEDEAVAALLNRYQVDAIDVAPSKYFPNVASASEESIESLRATWEARGISLLGMQSLFFGCQGLNLFDKNTQPAMLAHLSHVCRVANGLGIGPLVFGSPKCRDRGHLDQSAVDAISTEFFRRAGDIAARHDTLFCIEANPSRYGCNFMTSTLEAADVVARTDHPAVRLHLDTGTMAVNQESPHEILRQCAALVGYAHASEPDLVPLGSTSVDHPAIAHALREARLSCISIEMLTAPEQRLSSIESALQIATRAYRDSA
ncbi:MAG: TIM barrel protein [Pandoraea sp.]|nr:TIM barrel protein [Pandoraea sp.]MDR3396777.1 TIM barrel protein [Pandoraea sp.]